MDVLNEITERLKQAWEDCVVSIILYGSAASTECDSRSDLNLMCVLKEVTTRELAASEGAFLWWRQLGHPLPILVSQEEFFRSADSFPIEYHDLQERRRILYGADVVEDVHIHDRFYRLQIEHELRANLLRLRDQGAVVLSDPARLLALCMESVTTFLVLGRHALRYSGRRPTFVRREIAAELEAAAGIPSAPFLTLLDLREEKISPQNVDPVPLFEQYLETVSRIIRFVDRLEY
jgi:hypothetical protein